MYSLLFLGITAFFLSLWLTPVVRDLFLRLGVVDKPDNRRKLHKGPIPRVGGVAVALAYMLAFALLLVIPLHMGNVLRAFPGSSKIFPAAGIVFFVGLFDDLLGLRPWQKLTGQTLAACAAYAAGIHVSSFGGAHLAPWLSLPLTVLWLVACTNALNLIDGIDGLAAGIGLLATTTSLLAAGMQHNMELALATLPLLGSLLGFLRYNFNPATIFLGDCGSLFVGFLLGCYGVLWSQKSATMLGMMAPLIALSIPLLDTSLAILRRYLRFAPIMSADRGHIHHRLLERGFAPRTVALLLYAICAVAAIFSLSMVNNKYEGFVVVMFGVFTLVGIQRLGFIEFDTFGRMFVEGSFRRLLSSQISLRHFEAALSLAKTSDECWELLREAYRAFGFVEMEMRLAGCVYSDSSPVSNGAKIWRLEIPLSPSDYVRLTRECGPSAQNSVVAGFADVLHRTLEAKLAAFKAESCPELKPLQVLVTGD